MIEGKGGRQRALPVGEGVWRCIEAYLPYRYKELQQKSKLQEKALFVNRYGERLPDHAITQQIRLLCRKAGLPRINCHQFRHSCASDLLENGVNLPQVQQFLGHAAVETTMRYLDISDPKKKEAIDKHPINEFLAHEDKEEREER
jgi:integrase/recombinase XerC